MKKNYMEIMAADPGYYNQFAHVFLNGDEADDIIAAYNHDDMSAYAWVDKNFPNLYNIVVGI